MGKVRLEEERLQREAEEQARKDSEEKVRLVEERLQREAEEKAKIEAEEQERKDAEEKARLEEERLQHEIEQKRFQQLTEAGAAVPTTTETDQKTKVTVGTLKIRAVAKSSAKLN